MHYRKRPLIRTHWLQIRQSADVLLGVKLAQAGFLLIELLSKAEQPLAFGGAGSLLDALLNTFKDLVERRAGLCD